MFAPMWLPRWKLLFQKNEGKIPKSQQWWGWCPKGMVSHWDTLALCLVLGVMQRGAAFPRGLELMEQAVFHLQDVWYQHFLLHRARISSSEDKGRKWCFFFPAGCCSAVPSALGPRCSGL